MIRPEIVQEDVPVGPQTTLEVGGPARYFAACESMDELRRGRPSVALDDAPEVTDKRRDSSPSEVVEAAEDAELVHGALAELPELQRVVVTLRHLHDFSFGQIAEQMGRSNDAVRQLHQRGMARLRRQLQARPVPGD